MHLSDTSGSRFARNLVLKHIRFPPGEGVIPLPPGLLCSLQSSKCDFIASGAQSGWREEGERGGGYGYGALLAESSSKGMWTTSHWGQPPQLNHLPCLGVPAGRSPPWKDSKPHWKLRQFRTLFKTSQASPSQQWPCHYPSEEEVWRVHKKTEAQSSWLKTQSTLWPPKRRELRKVWNGFVEKESQTFLACDLRPL